MQALARGPVYAVTSGASTPEGRTYLTGPRIVRCPATGRWLPPPLVCYTVHVSANVDRLLRELLELDSAERVEIFDRLGAHLEAEYGKPVPDAWRDEISRRISRFDTGDTKPIAVEDLERDLWADQLADEQAIARP